MQVTLTFTYDVTDDLAERQRIYGCTEPAECADVDYQVAPEDLLSMADEDSIGVVIRPVPE